MSTQNTLRIMTYNVGGGRKDFGSEPTEVLKTIQQLSPDILAIQECVNWTDVAGKTHNFSDSIAKAGGYGEQAYFGPTLTLKDNLQIRKTVMLYALFNDITEWAQGNALFAKDGFSLLGDPHKPGNPRNVPLFKPPVYQGTRDTDPRYALLTRVSKVPYYPFVVNVHLTTLVGERGGHIREVPGKSEEAQMLRLQQSKRLVELVCPIQNPDNLILLLGDFNATPKEASIASVIESEGKFMRLVPKVDRATHPKLDEPVDHIFVYPADRIEAYSCWIEDSEQTLDASDHLPVVADITFR